MWQTFPEHTKNLTAASQEGHCKSLNGLARNRIQGPGSQAFGGYSPLPRGREPGSCSHSTGSNWTSGSSCDQRRGRRKCGVGGSGFQTHRRSGLRLRTVCVSRQPVAQPRGQVRPWTGPDVSHPGLGCSRSRAGAQTQTRWENKGAASHTPLPRSLLRGKASLVVSPPGASQALSDAVSQRAQMQEAPGAPAISKNQYPCPFPGAETQMSTGLSGQVPLCLQALPSPVVTISNLTSPSALRTVSTWVGMSCQVSPLTSPCSYPAQPRLSASLR